MIRNIKFIAIAYYTNGSTKERFFATEKAMSKWANAQYRKDNGVTVEVWNGIFESKYCTYHE